MQRLIREWMWMMKNIVLLLTVLVVSSLFFTSFASAERPFEANIKTPVVKSYCGLEAFLEIEITNKQATEEYFKISVDGPNSDEWFDLTESFFVGSASTDTIEIPIDPPRNVEGEFKYSVFVYGESNPGYKTGSVFIFKTHKICITSFVAEKTGDKLISDIELGSSEERDIDVIYELMDEKGIILTATFTEHVVITKKAQHTIELPEHLIAGEYSLIANLGGSEVEGTQPLSVEPKKELIETVTTVSTPLYEKVTVAIKNNGNVVENDVKVSQSTPGNTFTGYVTNPKSCQPSNGEVECDYVIPEIMPGETGYVIYRIEFWPYWATYALVGVVIVLIVGVSFLRITRPTLNKTSARKGKNNHSVILQIKNPFRHNLKNVVVRDWISPLARFDKNNLSGLRPVLRRSDAGTELIWRLGDIKPKEERIINYNIKTMVEGNLRMPKAYLRFRDSGDKRFRIYSKPVILS
ncbi:MAG: hypothetical protein ABIF08_01625 [Nanoarchaeota archaeon]